MARHYPRSVSPKAVTEEFDALMVFVNTEFHDRTPARTHEEIEANLLARLREAQKKFEGVSDGILNPL
jgi:hypothetical protein